MISIKEEIKKNKPTISLRYKTSMKALKEIKARNKLLNKILLNIINKLEDLKKLIQLFFLV